MTKFEEEVDKVAKQVGYESLSLLIGDCREANIIYTHFKNWHSDEEFQDKEKEIERLRKINHLYKKAKGNAERLAVDRGERLNQAQDELASLESQFQQQALPVVPECVADAIAWEEQNDNSIAETLKGILTANDKDLKEAGLWVKNNLEKYIIARNIGYTVEKPQLFYIDLPKVFGLSNSTSDSTFVSKAESGIISEFTKGKDYALKLTEQEIKSIDERYWQFAVPVEVQE